MKRFSNWLYHISSGWVALAMLAVFLLFTALVLPGQAASAESSSGEAGSPDMSFYYSSADLYRMAEAYGEQGRQAYLRARWTFDLLWPVIYTLFLSTSLSWLLGRVLPAGSRWSIMNITPAVGMLFDYLENTSTSLVMLRYPQPTPMVAALAPLFTSLKWVFVGGSFILLALGIAAAVWRWVGDRRK
jgi:hypothetical protein